MTKNGFKIELSEDFAHLPKAPIVEAIIHWRAHPQVKLEPEKLHEQLAEELSDYSSPQQQQEVHLGGEIGPGGASVQQKQVWDGFRLQSNDGRYVTQFTRSGLVVSRLKPYESWTVFETEALRMWEIFQAVAKPPEIQRLGVRYINILGIERLEDVGGLLSLPPTSPDQIGLPVEKFMHQTRFSVPGHQYELNAIQTIQPRSPVTDNKLGLILDLDVFTTDSLVSDDETLKLRLQEMRWIKNKAFFSFLTPNAIDNLKE